MVPPGARPPGARQPPFQCYPPPNPPSNHPHGGGQPSTTIRQDLICSYAILTCWPRATYALHNRIPECSVHCCL